jgi:hypothetical protein
MDVPGGVAETEVQESLAAALALHFSIASLTRLGNAYLQATFAPSVLLCIGTRYSLPGWMTWLSTLIWAALLILALTLLLAADARRRHLPRHARGAEPLVRLHFGRRYPAPVVSATLGAGAFLASVGLWLDAVHPGFVSADVLGICARSWMVLAVGTLVNRYLETHA